MIIDFHHHLLEEENYADKLIAKMDEAGIDKTCISGLGIGKGKTANWDLGAFNLGALTPDNDDVAVVLKKHPDRLIGMGFMTLGVDGPDKVDELLERGFQGLKVTRPVCDYDHDNCFPVYERAEQLNIPILFHTGVLLVTPFDKDDDVSSNRMRPIQIDRVARHFPNLRIVLAHMGMPWHDEAATMARFHKNVYCDFTGAIGGWCYRKTPDELKKLLFWDGAYKKMVFGTDVHYNEIAEALRFQRELMQNLGVDSETTDAFFSGNARGFFGM